MNIFGIKISNISKGEVINKINGFLTDGRQHFIVTPNPEILLRARKDEEFFYVLNQADLALPDGIGLKFAGWTMGVNLKRITGADLVPEILKIAEERNLKVAIVNWEGGLSKAKDIEQALHQKFSRLKVSVHDIGRDNIGTHNVGTHNYVFLHEYNPDILLVTLGAPYQEKFIFHNLPKTPSIKLAIGIGASIDYLSGKSLRAPKIMRNLGLEWLWRFFYSFSGQDDQAQRVSGPAVKFNRNKRIYNATIKFPLKFAKWRFVLPLLYRQSVACLLYKKEREGYRILLVRRAKSRDEHWQLPQGGKDAEDVETAGNRELREELNTDKFKTAGVFKNLFKYHFPREMDGQRWSGYKGQSQSLFIAEFLGKDEDIKINFWDHLGWKWIDADKLVEEVHPVRKESAQIFLDKFNKIINYKFTNNAQIHK